MPTVDRRPGDRNRPHPGMRGEARNKPEPAVSMLTQGVRKLDGKAGDSELLCQVPFGFSERRYLLVNPRTFFVNPG